MLRNSYQLEHDYLPVLVVTVPLPLDKIFLASVLQCIQLLYTTPKWFSLVRGPSLQRALNSVLY